MFAGLPRSAILLVPSGWMPAFTAGHRCGPEGPPGRSASAISQS